MSICFLLSCLLLWEGCDGRDAARGSGLPPPARDSLVAIFGPRVAPLGLRVTRVGLQDRESRGPSETGRHLALYVEPTSSWSDARFVETIVPLGRELVPYTFDRWGGLESFDVCQEPSPGVDDRPEPVSMTVLDITREGAAGVDWGRTDLPSLLAAVLRSPDSTRLFFARPLGEQPDLVAAEARARELAGKPG